MSSDDAATVHQRCAARLDQRAVKHRGSTVLLSARVVVYGHGQFRGHEKIPIFRLFSITSPHYHFSEKKKEFFLEFSAFLEHFMIIRSDHFCIDFPANQPLQKFSSSFDFTFSNFIIKKRMQFPFAWAASAKIGPSKQHPPKGRMVSHCFLNCCWPLLMFKSTVIATASAIAIGRKCVEAAVQHFCLLSLGLNTNECQ